MLTEAEINALAELVERIRGLSPAEVLFVQLVFQRLRMGAIGAAPQE